MYWFLQYKNDLNGNKLISPKYYNFVPRNYIDNFQIILDNYKLFPNLISPEYFTYVLPNQYLNSSFENEYYYYTFCLYPEINQPSGGISFGNIGGKQFLINLLTDDISEENPINLNIYYNKVSILSIEKGKARLLFFNKN